MRGIVVLSTIQTEFSFDLKNVSIKIAIEYYSVGVITSNIVFFSFLLIQFYWISSLKFVTNISNKIKNKI